MHPRVAWPMRRLSTILVLAMLLAVPLAALGPAQGSTVYYPSPWIQVGQELLRPGDDLSVLVHRAAGDHGEVRLVRLDPEEWVTDRSGLGSLEAKKSFSVDRDADRYTPRDVVFGNVRAGLYRVEGFVDGDRVGTQWLQVTGIAVLGRVAAGDAALWVVDLDSGRGVPGTLWFGANSTASVGADGLWTGAAPSGRVAVSTAEGPAALQTHSGRHSQQEPLAVYTDRPLYRPGQTVHAKLVAWDDGAAAEGSVDVTVSVWRHGKEETVLRDSLELGRYGTAALDVELPASAAVGRYEIEARLDGRSHHGSFQVEEYRLPEFRVDLAADRDRVAVGDPLEVLVKATRFYGEPIDEGEVRFEVVGGHGGCQPMGGFGDAPCLVHHAGTRSYTPPPSGGAASGSGRTELAPDGTARIRLVPDDAGAYDLRVRVTGVQGETIEERVPFTVHTAALQVTFGLEGRTAEPGSTVQVPVRVTDLAGRPVDAEVAVEAVQRTWSSSGSEESPLEDWTVRAVDGRGSITVAMPEQGRLELRAEVADEEGRTATASVSLYGYGSSGRADGLEVEPAEAAVAPGGPVQLRVGSDQVHPVLVTLEADGLHGARVVDLAQVGTVSFSSAGLPGREAHAVVTQLRLRDGVPTWAQESTTVRLDPAPRELQVDVRPDQDLYEDGDEARILVRVTDASGRPVQAEVSLAMVDEALLALQDRDDGLLGRLLPTPWKGTAVESLSGPRGGGAGYFLSATSFDMATTATSAPTTTDTATAAARAEMADAASAPPVQVREYFPETALWLPQAETDANGTLRVRAGLPDTLTTWHLVAVAVTRDAQVGEGGAELVTRKDLVADLFAPRFLVNGDEAVVQATVSNHMGRQRDVQVLLEADGVEMDGAAARTLSLAPGRTGLVSYPVHATAPGEAELTFYAWAPDEDRGDALRIRFPVHAHGVLSTESWGGKGAAEVRVRIPDAIDGNATLTVGLSGTAGDAVVEALPSLVQYPYGCVEQTLSRFLPAIAVARAADGYGLDRDEVAPDLDEVVEAGLDKLYGYQHRSGAWGWWTDDPDNPYTTAYVVYGLAVARDAGFDVDAEVLGRGVDALADMANEGSATVLGAYQRYALSVADPASVPDLPRGSGPAVAAMGLLTADALGRTEDAARFAAELEGSVAASGTLAHWDEVGAGWTDHGISSDTMLTALAARALLAHDPDHELVAPSVEWLLRDRDGLAWRTTKDTAETILTLAALMEASPASEGPIEATVSVAGQERLVRVGDKTPEPLRFTLPSGEHALRVEPDGAPLYWTAQAAYFETSEPIPARGDYTFERVVRDRDGDEVSELRVGEEATVTVTVQGPAKSRYVMVEDMLPAGVEVIPQEGCDWCRAWSHHEVRDDRVGFFASYMGAEQTFTYQIRAVWAGTYHVLPPRAEEMYDPDVRGHGAESVFRVLEHPTLQVGRVEVSEGRVQVNLHPSGDVPAEVDVDVIVDNGKRTLREELRAVLNGTRVRHLDLALPNGTGEDDTVRVVVRGGGAVAEAVVDPSVAETDTVPAFDEADESRWAHGDAVEVASGVASSSLRADFAAVFREVAKEPFGSDPTTVTERGGERGIPAMSWLVAALALVGLVALRRRRA